MEFEEWRPVVGHEGMYEISDLGRLRSVTRYVRSVRSVAGRRLMQGRALRLKQGQFYLEASLRRPGGGQRTVPVHTLVAEAFIGPRPPGYWVCHNDGDRYNNVPTNLRYDTPRSNALDTVIHGNHPATQRTHCPAGHPYDAENTELRGGHRHCRTCHRTRERERKRAMRARAKEAA